MADDTSAIPAELLARLEALKDVLSTNGIVQRRNEPRRRSPWRLRFRARGEDGRRHHRSIPLGGDTVARAVAALLEAWQQPRRLAEQARQARKAQQQAEWDRRQRHRQRRRRLQDLAGGCRRNRDRVGRLYDRAVQQGIQAEMTFCVGGGYLQPGPRRGRPCKSGLVLLG